MIQMKAVYRVAINYKHRHRALFRRIKFKKPVHVTYILSASAFMTLVRHSYKKKPVVVEA